MEAEVPDSLRYDTVIFDLDGTLTRSGIGIINCVKYALTRLGRPIPDDETLMRFVGPPLLESFIQYAGMDEDEAKRGVDIYRERFDAIGWRENEVYAGIATLLRTLKAHGAYVAVATGKPTAASERILRHFGLWPYIDRLRGVSLDDHHADKARLIADVLPDQPGRACMVGDRKSDLDGARTNGIDAIGALYGYGSRNELEGAVFIAETPQALSDWILDGTKPRRGLLVTFEGPDGCGKTTQLDRAANWLRERGFDVVTTREPGGCPISERIREIILDVGSAGMTAECEALLYAASRAQHVAQTLLPALDRGAVVLCDRYLDSSLAYQGGGRALGQGLVRAINAPATQGLEPDMTLFYDIAPDRAMRRRLAASEPDRIELEKRDFTDRVYAAYKSLCGGANGRIVTIDADRPIEAVERDTIARLSELTGLDAD